MTVIYLIEVKCLKCTGAYNIFLHFEIISSFRISAHLS
jgi:hypothetical protein